jgi:hypothetical protein
MIRRILAALAAFFVASAAFAQTSPVKFQWDGNDLEVLKGGTFVTLGTVAGSPYPFTAKPSALIVTGTSTLGATTATTLGVSGALSGNSTLAMSGGTSSVIVASTGITAPTNYAGVSGVGAKFSKFDITGASPGDHDRAAAYFKMTTDPAANASYGETTLVLNTVSNTGSSLVWAQSTPYVLNNYVRSNNSNYVYRQTVSSCTSASSGVGPTGNGTGITDGTCIWDYANDNPLNYTAGIYNGVLVYPGARPTWGMANNYIMMTGADTSFATGIEFDFSGEGDCTIGSENCYNIFMGMNDGPGTAWIAQAGQVSPTPYSAHFGLMFQGDRHSDTAAIADWSSTNSYFVTICITPLSCSKTFASFNDMAVTPRGLWARGAYSTAAVDCNPDTGGTTVRCLYVNGSYTGNAIDMNTTTAGAGLNVNGTQTLSALYLASTAPTTITVGGTYASSILDMSGHGGTAIVGILMKGSDLIKWSATGTYTVSALPTCNAGNARAIAWVTDLTGPTYQGTLTGGGAVQRIVHCDGTAWRS